MADTATAQSLSAQQIYAIARKAGFSPSAAVTMTAIAFAESGGHPTDLNNNPNTGDLSYGLWQINMIGSMGPERLKEFGLTDNSQLFDPLTNAKAAYIVSGHGQNFSPWSTYLSGAYAPFLGKAQQAASQDGGQPWYDQIATAIEKGVAGGAFGLVPIPGGGDVNSVIGGPARAVGNAVKGTVSGLTFIEQLGQIGVSGFLKLFLALVLVGAGFLLLFHKQVQAGARTAGEAAAAGAMA